MAGRMPRLILQRHRRPACDCFAFRALRAYAFYLWILTPSFLDAPASWWLTKKKRRHLSGHSLSTPDVIDEKAMGHARCAFSLWAMKNVTRSTRWRSYAQHAWLSFECEPPRITRRPVTPTVFFLRNAATLPLSLASRYGFYISISLILKSSSILRKHTIGFRLLISYDEGSN